MLWGNAGAPWEGMGSSEAGPGWVQEASGGPRCLGNVQAKEECRREGIVAEGGRLGVGERILERARERQLGGASCGMFVKIGAQGRARAQASWAGQDRKSGGQKDWGEVASVVESG